MSETYDARKEALKVARLLGCRGVHQHGEKWMPCADHETLLRISDAAEKKVYEPKKRRPKRQQWEKLTESGVVGIDTLPGGGLVSARIGAAKAVMAARRVRRSDPDAFSDRESARIRSRQLGCIGIRQYPGTDGQPVWMPCTNESDYRRQMGTSPQGRRDIARQEVERFRRYSRMKDAAAPPSEQITGSSTNPSGSASSRDNDIELSESTLVALNRKVRTHNERMRELDKDKWSIASSDQLRAVYRRGAGAYSTSHRKGMTRGQWAMARVNAFLKMLRQGRPENLRYINDVDLLPKDHPWRKKVRR
jgi:hypothetical protein